MRKGTVASLVQRPTALLVTFTNCLDSRPEKSSRDDGIVVIGCCHEVDLLDLRPCLKNDQMGS